MGLLDGLTVVITGAGQGLGRAYARACAAQGAAVVVNDIVPERADAVTAELVDAGHAAHAVIGDVALPGTAERIVAEAVAAFGGLDGFVANAGVLAPGPGVPMDRGGLEQALWTNVIGVAACGAAALSVMTAAGRGSFVTIVSGAAQGLDGLAAYGTSKAAVIGMSAAWALETVGTGVRVNAVSPLARTGMSELMGGSDVGKGGQPEGIAPVVVHLLSPAAAELHGQVIRFDGSRLGIVAPPRLVAATEPREDWDADRIAAALGGPLRPWHQPIGLAAAPAPVVVRTA